MDILATGDIYSIAVGDPKNGWKFTVGKGFTVMGEYLEIVRILRDDGAFYIHGTIRYVVYVKKEDGEVFCWRYFENHKVDVTCKV